MKAKLISLITIASLASLVLAGAALAAGPDPKAAPRPGQGTLEIKSLDNELTISYQGTGYNLHRFSTLRLAVDPGQNDFDYFCGGRKYFRGNVKVAAGQTTTIVLEADGCVEAAAPAVPSGPMPEQQAYADGYAIGLVCGDNDPFYSSDPAIQAIYVQGFLDGWYDAGCDGA